jgi:hypothetical protein
VGESLLPDHRLLVDVGVDLNVRVIGKLHDEASIVSTETVQQDGVRGGWGIWWVAVEVDRSRAGLLTSRLSHLL